MPAPDSPVEQWQLVLHRTARPWWGLGLVARDYEVVATQATSEEEALRQVAELKATFPKWDLELRRT